MRPLVIYHDHCADGFTAAWVVSRFFNHGVELLPASYGDEPPDAAGREVIIVDFSYKRDAMLALIERAESMQVLDHHESAQRELEGLECAIFDMSRSGAQLAWDFFGDGGTHWLVSYVQDRDLWRWELHESRAVSAYIACQPKTMERWDRLAGAPLHEIVARGEAIQSYIEKCVDDTVARARLAYFQGDHFSEIVPCVSCSPEFASEVGNKLCVDAPFAVMFYETEKGWKYSLRSSKDSGLNVAKIAEAFGGGGHANAAGCLWPGPIHTWVK